MNIGEKIRYFRKQKGMKLEDLANGLCSVSHLSKIENNKDKPHQELAEKLFEKLGIPFIADDPKQIEEIKGDLEKWIEVIKKRNRKKAVEMEKMIQLKVDKVEDAATMTTFQLFSIRYQLLLGNLDESEKMINQLNNLIPYFSDEQTYYFYYFYAIHQYLHNELIDSLIFVSKAEKINQKIQMNEPELFYLMAIIHSKLYHVTLAVQYANIALDLFNLKLDYVRSSECQIIMAINYIRLEEYDRANDYLRNVLQLAEELKDSYLTGNVYHNLGYLYSKQGEHQKAIEYYYESLTSKEVESDEYVNTIYYLVQEYLVLEKYDLAKEWIEKGLSIRGEDDQYYIRLKILQSIHTFQTEKSTKNEESKKKIKDAQKNIANNAIPYLEKKQRWNEVSEYAEILANHYANFHQYKTSSHYYKIANNARKKIYM